MGIGDEDNIDATLGLGELAQLTVNNDAESTYDIASSKEAFRKTWNAKYTLRSHFDGVRCSRLYLQILNKIKVRVILSNFNIQHQIII